ncbi:MAG: DUF192 domain-containing protein [Candidatus Eremiobacteraeota bacterium]|nr:DUF192 domain-containing protein [Candidatus Eremiobacteraeota bacterium]
MSSFVAAMALACITKTLPPAVSVQAPKATLRMEVADTPKKREIGLMYRRSLPAHTGMVFVFSTDSIVGFWMKNTLIPLDMVFIGSDGVVRAVYANVPSSTLQTPESKIARRSGEGKFVFELPPGEAAKDGLVPGALVAGVQKLSALH